MYFMPFSWLSKWGPASCKWSSWRARRRELGILVILENCQCQIAKIHFRTRCSLSWVKHTTKKKRKVGEGRESTLTVRFVFDPFPNIPWENEYFLPERHGVDNKCVPMVMEAWDCPAGATAGEHTPGHSLDLYRNLRWFTREIGRLKNLRTRF